ncbi:MAG: ABC transporter permease [Planctomycetota bacterium]|jgi:ribose/xylose/arabinose/galactoside ABC-type transport system permease subunit|nr:ABC transporter permease [Planctomycetota bacterium]
MPALARVFRDHLSSLMPLLCLALVLGVFTSMNANFLGVYNITSILTDTAPLLLVAGSLTFVLLLGCIDLSTGSIISCSCVIAGLYISETGSPVMLVLMALMGVLAGLLNGLVYTLLRVPTFVATLCTSAVWQCAALLISDGKPKGIPIKQWSVINWSKFTLFDLFPITFLVALGFLAILFFIQNRTRVGKSIYAVGANEKASRMMGVATTWTKLAAFTLAGVGSALAGVFYAIKLRSSLPQVGTPLTLMAIAAVVLGGTTLTGGIGGVLRTLVGVLLVIAIQNGLNLVGVDAFWQQICFGTLVIVAIILNADKSGRDIIIK